MPFYAVKTGKKPGVYKTWGDCQSQTVGFNGAQFKKFDTQAEAEDFVRGGAKVSPAKIGATTSKRGAAAAHEPEDRTSPKRKLKPAGVTGKNQANVYVEGVCYIKGKSGVGVFWGDGSNRNISEELIIDGVPSMNRSAVQAAVRALKQAKELNLSKVTINSSNSFLVQSMTQWVPKWINNGWKTTKGKPVANAEDLQQLAEVAENLDVEWVGRFSPGHTYV
ncbi:putative Ribonuclease H1 [Hypsibius exemplaris]|uniref:Ribonuclease H n=1 Tax=Hypsibius exemplaris TaxID=2072580 RepID=A0A9X6RKZ7_HYPEX|nr:putative Ribonuclease H1 [Hypsibius exemplaris]